MRLLQHSLPAGVALCLACTPPAAAQTIRGVVVDRADRPVAGVVMMLLDSTSRPVTRVLSNERGEFRLSSGRGGTYRVSSLRIGYRPSLTQSWLLSPGATLTERISLNGIEVTLDTMKVVATTACHVDAEQGAATFAVWEQARTALLAADLTRSSRTITSTTIVHDRTLDAAGRRTLRQNSSLRVEPVAQPWRAAAPDTLHRTGFVVVDQDNATTYHAPGLEMLVSDVFLADHCFHLTSGTDGIGLAFEPTAERAGTTEIAGTIWLDRGSAALRSLVFQYVNLPPELAVTSGGTMEFARLSNGAWAVSRWNITMPVVQKRVRSSAFGGNDIAVTQVESQGGELVLALRGRDTVYAQPPRLLRGVAHDSVTGRAIPGVRVAIAGTTLNAVADDRGRFEVRGVLPGVYTLQVRTASLDSVSAIHQAEVEFTDEAEVVEIRVPNAAALIGGLCGAAKYDQPGVIVGQVVMRGGAAFPADTRILVDWRAPVVKEGAGLASVTSVHDHRETRTSPQGAFRVCGVPVESDLAVHALSDSGFAGTVATRIAGGVRVARAELTMERPAGATAILSGRVLLDSTNTPLAGVVVTVTDLARDVRTDERGVFRLAAIPAGAHRVTIRRIGFGGLDTTLTFAPGEAVQREIRLNSIAELAELNTSASRLPLSFEEHRKLALGISLDRAALARMEGRKLSEVLSERRGVLVLHGYPNHGWITSSRRQECPPNVGFCMVPHYDPVGTEVREGVKRRCYAKVYLDHSLMNRGSPVPPFDVNSIAVEQLEGVEFFSTASEVPAEYSGNDLDCGVLVLYTRSSR